LKTGGAKGSVSVCGNTARSLQYIASDYLQSNSKNVSEGLQDRGVSRGAKFPRRRVTMVQITAGGVEWLWDAPKSPQNITSTFLNTVHLLPKGAKLASCPGSHLTSLRPYFRMP